MKLVQALGGPFVAFRFTENFAGTSWLDLPEPSLMEDSYSATLNVWANLDGVDVGQFDPSTPFHLVMGDLSLDMTLGADPSFYPGKTSVTFHQQRPCTARLLT